MEQQHKEHPQDSEAQWCQATKRRVQKTAIEKVTEILLSSPKLTYRHPGLSPREPPSRGEMTPHTTAESAGQVSPDHAPGVQLASPDLAHATQPGLFDDLPESAFTVEHRLLINSRPADRMLLCLVLDVSASAVKVAVALAYHGWTSWPSRDTLATLAKVHPNHVSRACKELEDAGIIRRQRRYHKGGHVGIQYTFNGPSLVSSAAVQDHPTLGHAIHALASPEIAANTELVSAPENPQNQRSSANTELVSAQPGGPDREYRIGISANTNPLPEPEMIEPEEVTAIDDINQSNSGYSGYSGSISPDDRSFPASADLPDWYQQLERQLDAAIVPDFNTLQEAAMLAGWTDKVMAAAARLYARNYGNQRVNNPVALFRKLAIQEASKVAVPPKQSRPSHSEDRGRRR